MTSPAPYSAIPEHLEGPLLTRAGEINPTSGRRWTNDELSRWLKEAHGIDAGRMSVQRCLSRLRRERAALLKEALTEDLLASLRDDWARLDLAAEDLYALAQELRAKNPKGFVACLAEVRKIAATKALTLGRAEPPGESDELTLKLKGQGAVTMTFYLPEKRDLDADDEPDAAQRGDVATE